MHHTIIGWSFPYLLLNPVATVHLCHRERFECRDSVTMATGNTTMSQEVPGVWLAGILSSVRRGTSLSDAEDR